ncbi:NAD-dependent epimerase/dehydratase family protein [Tautonia sociabilis]|uniref:NAD-dependent epimerase/dehydratase family protein n=2 Tax=Tautonia sociabilis TaxID=2080755 RepID=A0A432MGF0_9BACT|nr:NAD-dependent epimerase/dehydratase family protein [Tautonia sociabilis]
MRRLDGDLIVLGASGKMGPTLAWMARRASDAAGVSRRVIGVARFSDPSKEAWLRDRGIEPIRCDLLDPDQIERLPEVPNVVHMPAFKFGATGNQATAWAVNCFLPGLVCRKYRSGRIVAFSTGNVYPLVPVDSGGSKESDPLRPVGDYGMSCVGRERIMEHFSRAAGTPMAIIRLNYAVEMRYGVLVDIGRKVLAGEPIDVAMGHLNAIWQGDANAMTLAAFDHVCSPPFVLNVTGPETLSVRKVAERFEELLGREARITGVEAPDALLSDSSLAGRLMGPPRIDADRLLTLVADWLRRGQPMLDKPTRFEVRDGQF